MRANPDTLMAGITRHIKKRRLANPRHGLYLILRPEDTVTGAPDPVRWIAPLMQHQGVHYCISLLRAAAVYESATVRRLGYLVELPGHTRQAKALASFG